MNSSEEKLEALCIKYQMEIIDGVRYYKLNLSDDCFDCANTSPSYIKIGNKTIQENKWTKLLLSLFKYLDSIEHKTNEELLAIDVPNSRRVIFSDNPSKGTNKVEARKGLYFYNGVDSSFAGTIILLLLKEYNIDLSKCVLCVRYIQYYEPDEVCDYFVNVNKEKFKNYLERLRIRGLNSDNIEKTITFIDFLNDKYLCGVSHNTKYKNLFAFDNYDLFSDCKTFVTHELVSDTYCVGLILDIDFQFGPVDSDNILVDDFSEPTDLNIKSECDKNDLEIAKYNEENGRKVLNLLDGFYSLEEELNNLGY